MIDVLLATVTLVAGSGSGKDKRSKRTEYPVAGILS